LGHSAKPPLLFCVEYFWDPNCDPPDLCLLSS
jgi:hypothetical protein